MSSEGVALVIDYLGEHPNHFCHKYIMGKLTGFAKKIKYQTGLNQPVSVRI
jgi:hypothetical protein